MNDPKKVIRKLWRICTFYVNSILSKLHYAVGSALFPSSKKEGRPRLDDIDVIVLNDPRNPLGITLPSNYKELVDTIYAEVLERYKKTVNCNYRSADEAITEKLRNRSTLPEFTADIVELQQQKVGSVRLNKTLDLPGLNELASAILPQVESKVYHAPLIVEVVTVYRNLPSVLPEHASTLWHSDNHYEGILKIMIYLNDVTEKNAPFEYLRHTDTHQTVHVTPAMPQKYPAGRVPPDVIEGFKQNGYESYKATGPAGTMMIFDDKIMHKGNYAEEGFRDVLVFQMKPSLLSRPYIDPAYTRAN